MRRTCIALLLVLLQTVAPANAATQFSASIIDLTPALPSSRSTIRMQLQLANPGATDVRNLSAQLFISTAPLVGRSQIDDISKGQLLPTYRVIDTYAASGLDLASGASTTIPIAITTRQLGLRSDRPGVYTFGVIVTASGAKTVRVLTFLPWLPSPGIGKSLRVIPVITISAPPQRSLDGTFLNDSLPISISGGGRLRSQLDAMLLVPRATWLLDPITLEAVQALSSGARINADDGVRAASNDEMDAARRWLDDLRVVAARGQVYAIPEGDLDVRAALKFGHRTLVRDAIGTAAPRVAAVLGVPRVPLAVQIYDGSVTASTWAFLQANAVDAALVSDSAYLPTQRLYTPSTVWSGAALKDSPVLVIDRASSDVLAQGRPEQLLRQQLAAQLLMIYLEQPNKQRTITVALPQTWVPELTAGTSALFSAPWISQTAIVEADGGAGDDRRVVVAKATSQQRKQEKALVRGLQIQRLLQRLTADEVFNVALRDSVAGIDSRWFTAGWITDRYTVSTHDELQRLADSVRVVTRGDIVFGGENGVVPVTIANGLPVPIDLILRAGGLPSVRVEPQPSMTVRLNAGKRASVEIPTRVTGSGTAYLQLWLETPQGELVGEPVLLDIRSAAYARVAGYLVAAAFVMLLLLVGVNTVRRIRVRSSEVGTTQ